MQQSIFSYPKILMKKTIKRPVEKKICVILAVILWITGLILAGSDGVLMPYLNVAGAVVFFGDSVWLGSILPCLEQDTQVKTNPKKKVLQSVSPHPMSDHCFADMIMAAPRAPII